MDRPWGRRLEHAHKLDQGRAGRLHGASTWGPPSNRSRRPHGHRRAFAIELPSSCREQEVQRPCPEAERAPRPPRCPRIRPPEDRSSVQWRSPAQRKSAWRMPVRCGGLRRRRSVVRPVAYLRGAFCTTASEVGILEAMRVHLAGPTPTWSSRRRSNGTTAAAPAPRPRRSWLFASACRAGSREDTVGSGKAALSAGSRRERAEMARRTAFEARGRVGRRRRLHARGGPPSSGDARRGGPRFRIGAGA